ncbi:MAG: response regulator [Polyangiaceae bacterium]
MSKVILLVEDNPTDEKLTLVAFKKCGIANDIAVARDGAQALDYLLGDPAGSEPPALPTIVLLDLRLPKIDGLEVLRRLREEERTKLLPVIILTSSKEDEDVAQGYALGCNAYVRKPVDFGEFAQAARALGLFWLLWNESPPQARSSP